MSGRVRLTAVTVVALLLLSGARSVEPARAAIIAPAGTSVLASPGIGAYGAMCFTDASHGWLVGESGFVSATDDGGDTWYRQYTPTTTDLRAVHFIDESHGWALGTSMYGTEPSVILRTSDGGLTWTIVRSEYTARYDALCFADSQNGWAVGWCGESLPYGLVLHTTNGGLTWTRQNPFVGADPYPGRAYTAVYCTDPSTVWVCAESGIAGDGYSDLHIYRSTNAGTTWSEVSSGPYVAGGGDDMWEFSDMQFLDASTGWVVGTAPGVLRTDNGGNGWLRQAPAASSIDMYDSVTGVAANYDALLSTANGGETWTTLYPGAPLGFNHRFVDAARPAPATILGLAAVAMPEPTKAEYVVRSTDGGGSWGFREIDGGIVEFIGGMSRYDTAVEISQATFASADTVILATGAAYPDALTASGLAGYYDAPILLTPDTLPASVLGEMRRLGASKIIIIGGSNAVSDTVETQLSAEFDVERIGGANRYDTARLVAEELYALGADTSRVFVTRGDQFADALSAAPYAASQKMPVVLVRTGDLPSASESALQSIEASEAVVVGGEAAVSETVVLQLDALLAGEVIRPASGSDRYDTSARLAGWASDEGWLTWARPGVATGATFPDGLVGGAALGHAGQALLLVRPDSLPPSAQACIETHAIDIYGVWVFGDQNGAVGNNVANAIGQLVAR